MNSIFQSTSAFPKSGRAVRTALRILLAGATLSLGACGSGHYKNMVTDADWPMNCPGDHTCDYHIPDGQLPVYATAGYMYR